jgi:hypothetical protein
MALFFWIDDDFSDELTLKPSDLGCSFERHCTYEAVSVRIAHQPQRQAEKPVQQIAPD